MVIQGGNPRTKSGLQVFRALHFPEIREPQAHSRLLFRRAGACQSLPPRRSSTSPLSRIVQVM